ncbi:MAG: type II toxin-antitoxin system VapC family toxin [Thermoleophilaceae bacterium]
MTARAVLDASAVLALLARERGADEVRRVLPGAAISAVNLGEVLERQGRRGLDLARERGDFIQLGLSVVPFDEEAAEGAAALWAPTRKAGLSLADRSCLELAARLAVPALTADRAWAALGIAVEVRLIR